MFNYSITMPSIASGIGAGQYTLPWDYMTSSFYNPNYLYNSMNAMSPFMMQGYNYYNPMFTANNTSSTTTKKKEKFEYTPVYAADEIIKTTEQPKKKSNAGTCFAIGAGIVALIAGGCALVNGAKGFSGSTWQYLGSLCKKGGNAVKNLFSNTLGNVAKPFKYAGNAVANGTKNCWGKVAGWFSKIIK